MWIKMHQTRDEAFEQFLDDLADAERREKLRKAYAQAPAADDFDHHAARPVVILAPHHD